MHETLLTITDTSGEAFVTALVAVVGFILAVASVETSRVD